MNTNAPRSDETSERHVEAVVGVFETPNEAQNAALTLRNEGVEFRHVRRIGGGQGSTDAAEVALNELEYQEVQAIETTDVAKGASLGGGIGAVGGLVLMAVPGLGFAAPIAGMLGGALIGGMAGLDEKNRAIELPEFSDYQKMVRDGKSLLVITGNSAERHKYELKLKELGAVGTYQHPPIGEMVPGTMEK